MALRVGETIDQEAYAQAAKIAEGVSAPTTPTAPTAPTAKPQVCDAVSDSILESIFNPNCGLDIYETCDEKTWVDCKIASTRLGLYIFAAIVVITTLIIFFMTDGFGKVIVVLIAAGLLLLAKFGSSWVGLSARTEYQRMEKEIEGIMRKGDLTRKEAVMQLRDEKLRREQTAALMSQRGQPAQTGLVAGTTAALVTGLINRSK